MLNRTIRSGYERFTLRWGRVADRFGITPNTLTAAGVVSSIVCCWLFAIDRIFPALLAFGLVGLFDILDGATARATGTVSRRGKVIDMVADRYTEYFFMLGILLGGRVAAHWVLTAVFAMLVASYTRAVAESKGGLADCEVGIVGRAEKMILIAVGGLLEIGAPSLGLSEFHPLQVAVILTAAASLVTAIQRLRYAAAALSEEGP